MENTITTTEEKGNTAVWLTGILALFSWTIAAWSCVDQKRSADRLVGDAFDPSAVQIQQLNGQVTAHVVVAIALAMALTIPLLLSVAVTLTTRKVQTEWVNPPEG